MEGKRERGREEVEIEGERLNKNGKRTGKNSKLLSYLALHDGHARVRGAQVDPNDLVPGAGRGGGAVKDFVFVFECFGEEMNRRPSNEGQNHALASSFLICRALRSIAASMM